MPDGLLPSVELLHELFAYDVRTGVLTWRPRAFGYLPVRWNKLHAGKAAGTVTPDGSILIKLSDQNYLAHRIIWAMAHGEWPECVLHRNGNRSDNRLKNLRAASRKAVQRNLPMLSPNTSGVRGVSWASRRCKWVASIKIDDFSFNLGTFERKEDAARARLRAEKRRDRLKH